MIMTRDDQRAFYCTAGCRRAALGLPLTGQDAEGNEGAAGHVEDVQNL